MASSFINRDVFFSTTPKLFAIPVAKTPLLSFLLNEYFVTTPFFKLTN